MTGWKILYLVLFLAACRSCYGVLESQQGACGRSVEESYRLDHMWGVHSQSPGYCAELERRSEGAR